MVSAIYCVDPVLHVEQHVHLSSNGFYRLVDRRFPQLLGSEKNFKNLARVCVSAKSLDEAWYLIELGYGIRIKTAKNTTNYIYDGLKCR